MHCVGDGRRTATVAEINNYRKPPSRRRRRRPIGDFRRCASVLVGRRNHGRSTSSELLLFFFRVLSVRDCGSIFGEHHFATHKCALTLIRSWRCIYNFTYLVTFTFLLLTTAFARAQHVHLYSPRNGSINVENRKTKK